MSTSNLDILEELHAEKAAAAPRRGVLGSIGLGGMVLLIGIAAVAVVFGVALIRQLQEQPTSGPAPDFELTTFDGETMRLSDFRGQVVVLNFWAGWCVPCHEEAPDLQATWEAYRDRGVTFLGVAWADNGPRSLEFLERHSITYPNGPDLGTRISAMYNIRGVPETFIIDQNGDIVKFIYAPISQAQLSRILDDVLAGQERGL